MFTTQLETLVRDTLRAMRDIKFDDQPMFDLGPDASIVVRVRPHQSTWSTQAEVDFRKEDQHGFEQAGHIADVLDIRNVIDTSAAAEQMPGGFRKISRHGEAIITVAVVCPGSEVTNAVARMLYLAIEAVLITEQNPGDTSPEQQPIIGEEALKTASQNARVT